MQPRDLNRVAGNTQMGAADTRRRPPIFVEQRDALLGGLRELRGRQRIRRRCRRHPRQDELLRAVPWIDFRDVEIAPGVRCVLRVDPQVRIDARLGMRNTTVGGRATTVRQKPKQIYSPRYHHGRGGWRVCSGDRDGRDAWSCLVGGAGLARPCQGRFCGNRIAICDRGSAAGRGCLLDERLAFRVYPVGGCGSCGGGSRPGAAVGVGQRLHGGTGETG